MIRRFSLLAAVAALSLAGCTGFPRAQFKISAFGFEAGCDTRLLTNDIGDFSASMIRGVGVEPPVIDVSAAVASESVR